jgi:hypothetical protein
VALLGRQEALHAAAVEPFSDHLPATAALVSKVAVLLEEAERLCDR